MRARGGGVRGTSRSARCCFSGSACMRQTLTARCCPVFRSSAAYTLRSTRRMSCSPSPIRRQHGWVARHLLSRDAEADAPEQPQRGGAAGDHLLPNQRVRAAALHLRIGGLQRAVCQPESQSVLTGSTAACGGVAAQPRSSTTSRRWGHNSGNGAACSLAGAADVLFSCCNPRFVQSTYLDGCWVAILSCCCWLCRSQRGLG